MRVMRRRFSRCGKWRSVLSCACLRFCFASAGSLGHLDKLARSYVVEVAIDGNSSRNQGMSTDSSYIRHDALLKILNRKPVYVLAGGRASAASNILPTAVLDDRGFEALR